MLNRRLRVQVVSSLEAPELRPYRTLRRPAEHRREGIFVAEGEKVVRRLIDSDLSLISLLMTPEWHDHLSSEGRWNRGVAPDSSTSMATPSPESFIAVYLVPKAPL